MSIVKIVSCCLFPKNRIQFHFQKNPFLRQNVLRFSIVATFNPSFFFLPPACHDREGRERRRTTVDPQLLDNCPRRRQPQRRSPGKLIFLPFNQGLSLKGVLVFL